VPREEIEQVAGELEVIDLEEHRRAQRREQGRAGSFDELVQLGIRRGYKNPRAWANHVHKARMRRRA